MLGSYQIERTFIMWNFLSQRFMTASELGKGLNLN